MSTYETLLVTRVDGVVTIAFNRPHRRNALIEQMWYDLISVFREVTYNREDRVVVLTGAGDSFCSGADLGEVSDPDLAVPWLTQMQRSSDTALALHRLPKPTIAKVNGDAIGGGCNLALGCDLVVAADTARFSEIFSRRGLSPDVGGSWILPRLIGLHKARELAYFGEVISASEAETLGLINRVVPASELDSAVSEWAAKLAAMSPEALSSTKAMLTYGATASMAEALEFEARSQAVNLDTPAMRAAVASYLAR